MRLLLSPGSSLAFEFRILPLPISPLRAAGLARASAIVVPFCALRIESMIELSTARCN
jgi:hypothetical protein